VRIAINESGLFDFLVQYYFTLPSQDRKQAACLEVKRGFLEASAGEVWTLLALPT
jgi:hypothetical protein